jgi:hypothetical protein
MYLYEYVSTLIGLFLRVLVIFSQMEIARGSRRVGLTLSVWLQFNIESN